MMTCIWSLARTGFALIGLMTVILLTLGLVLDVRAIDNTRGAYAPPYTGFTGEPIRWETLDTTSTGMVYRGRVVDLLVDCGTGMMRFDVFGVVIPWRVFSERAIVVPKPREACEQRGFDVAWG